MKSIATNVEAADASGLDKKLSVVCVNEKIKLIAERRPYFGIHQLKSQTNTGSLRKLTVDKMEDTSDHHCWRWELTTLELLAKPVLAEVKRARAARKKLASHYKAILKLLDILEKSRSVEVPSMDISDAEERVLKFERDEESKRLLDQENENQRIQNLKAKEEQRMAQKLKKDQEKAKKDEEKRAKEQERALKNAQKEEEKRLKDEEKQKAKEEKELQEEREAKLVEERKQKQRDLMAKFFTSDKAKKSESRRSLNSGAKNQMSLNSSEYQRTQINSHNTEVFWKQLGGSRHPSLDERRNTFQKKALSRPAKMSRRRRTEQIKVSVTVTVAPPPGTFTAFNEDQFYSERRIISVPNKFKFLKFFEDYRPPYRGTWSKAKSKLVSGRRSFGKDNTYLNYEVDSEAEWEEEEEVEDGEDLNSVMKEDEEEDADEDPGVDSRNYNYSDGWLAQDDEIDGETEEDECTTQKQKRAKNEDGVFSPWCLVAPLSSGVPACYSSSSSECGARQQSGCVLGMPSEDAFDFLLHHKSFLLTAELNVCLDPYKPIPEAPSKSKGEEGNIPAKKEINADELRVFCQFIHGCTLSSKEKVVEEFRQKHQHTLCSRAELFRKLDLIGIKHRIPKGGGMVWEVKRDFIVELGLNDVLKVKICCGKSARLSLRTNCITQLT